MNIGNMNAEGVANGYMMSTFSLPDEVKKGGSNETETKTGTFPHPVGSAQSLYSK